MRNPALRSALVATLLLGAAACGSDDDTDTPTTTAPAGAGAEGSTTTAGGPTTMTLEDIEALVTEGLAADDYEATEVTCPVELTQSATTLDCNVTLADGTEGFATVTASAAAVTLDHFVVIGSTVPTEPE